MERSQKKIVYEGKEVDISRFDQGSSFTKGEGPNRPFGKRHSLTRPDVEKEDERCLFEAFETSLTLWKYGIVPRKS